MKSYYVYIATNASGTLYIGVTNNLERRMFEHQSADIPGFTSRYKIDRLIYFEETNDINSAIEREKQIKRWRREKKIALVCSINPRRLDLLKDLSRSIP